MKISFRHSKKILIYFLIFLVLAYLSFGAIVYFVITPHSVFQNDKSKNESFIVEPKREFIKNKEGENLEMLIFNSNVKNTAIVYFGGAPGRSPKDLNTATQIGTVFSLAVPGYGRSEGNPSDQNYYETAILAIDYVKSKGFKDSDIIVIGHSLGGSQALWTATKFPDLKKVITVNTFYSMERMCEKDKPIFICIFDTFYLNTSLFAPDVKGKIIMFHNPNDGYIPFQQGKDLFQKIGSTQKIFHEIEGTHGDFDVIHALTTE